MSKTACQYAIVRFTPFIETGEFANVGIVMLTAKGQEMSCKLLTRRHRRVTSFFNELDVAVFKAAMQDLTKELDRINKRLINVGMRYNITITSSVRQQVFTELIRPRETILRFSDPRTILADCPHQTLEKLYSYYVERDFLTKQYRERVLEKNVRKWLHDAHLDRLFTQVDVGDDVYRAKFPFVQQEGNLPVKIIKPLNLGQDSPSKILEHGGAWHFKITQLKRRHALPEMVLFAVEGPQEGKQMEAYNEAVDMLSDTGAVVLPYNHQAEIVEFARA